jgi:hypothetical protein
LVLNIHPVIIRIFMTHHFTLLLVLFNSFNKDCRISAFLTFRKAFSDSQAERLKSARGFRFPDQVGDRLRESNGGESSTTLYLKLPFIPPYSQLSP